MTSGSATRPAFIKLMGERQFPAVHTDLQEIVDDLRDLGLSPATTALLERWMALVEDDRAEDHDDAVLAGLRAAAAVKREVGPFTRVNFAMRDPRLGDWFSVDARNPGDPD